MIRLFRNFKVIKTDNVMNVKLSSVLRFGNSARLTGVVISTSGTATLALPVSTIVSLVIATAPEPVIFSTIPLISTIKRTKTESPCTCQGSRNYNMLSALFAIIFGNGLCREWWKKSIFSGLTIALVGTDGYKFCLYLKWLTGKNHAADLASMSIIVLFRLASKLIGALTAASGLSTKLQSLRVC